MLVIGSAVRRAIEAEGEAGYPREICGFLLGRMEGAVRRVARIRPVRNAWSEAPEIRDALFERRPGEGPSREEWEGASEERRFLIDPRDYAAVDREARAADLEIVGFYHSHPDPPAEPARDDQEMAMPDQSYVIVSIRAARAADFRSWLIPTFGAPFLEEQIEAPASLQAQRHREE
jgi:proteasome lid subunit RPN8/RPN11